MIIHPTHICGIDEAGRGPLFGPVIAAAVILDPARPIEGLNDSKKLTEKKRTALEIIIKESALAWAIGRADAAEIDRINILQATFLAMQRAFEALPIQPAEAWIDGNQYPKLPCRMRAIIGGDALVPAISAASILAKVARDREMLAWHAKYPEYQFDRHKGYPTAAHLAALRQFGATPHHRCSFAPVAAINPVILL